jgi:hypothetical protein
MPDESSPDLVTKVLENDYFRLKLDEIVRVRTQANLDVWWKRVVAVAGIIGFVLTLAGVKEYLSITNTRHKIEEDSNKLLERIEADRKGFVAEIDGIRKELHQSAREQANTMSTRIAEASKEMAGIRADNEEIRRRVLKTVDEAAAGQLKTAEESGRFKQMFENGNKTLGQGEQNLNSAKALLSETQVELQRIRDEKKKRDDELKKAEESMQGPISSLTGDVENLKAQVFGTGSYVVREKQRNPIVTGVPGSEQELIIEVGVLDADTLHNLRIYGPKLIQVQELGDYALGRQTNFTIGKYKYSLTARYILELLWSSDAAGIDLTWSKAE